jgi:hypothetical protein
MATRSTVQIPRIERERVVPWVRCTYADTLDERWDGQLRSCGALIPFHPKHPCRHCGQIQARAHAEAPKDHLVIDGPAQIIDAGTGEVVCVHWTGAESIATRIQHGLNGVAWHDEVGAKINNSGRLSGLRVSHRVFGYTQPAPMRQRYGCATSSFNLDHPDVYADVEQFCLLAEWVFRTFAPDVHEHTGTVTRKAIPDAWRIAGTLWTSGIINNTAALPMHKDSSNVKGSWSAMLGCRRQMGGGLLYLADYDCYLSIPHGSISIFDGQSVVHGVTPMEPRGPQASRYTLVSYSKTAMCRCAPKRGDEVRRAALAATRAEDNRMRRGT